MISRTERLRRLKISLKMRGKNNPSVKYGPWNKGKKLSKEHIENLRKANTGKPKFKLRGRKLSSEHIQKIRLAHLGRKRSQETRLRMRLAHLGKRQPWSRTKWLGEKNPRWSGGPGVHGRHSSNFRHKISHEIMQRDGQKCKMCGKRSDLIVHHIDKNKQNDTVTNLITLCRPCHTKVHITKNKVYEHRLLTLLGGK